MRIWKFWDKDLKRGLFVIALLLGAEYYDKLYTWPNYIRRERNCESLLEKYPFACSKWIITKESTDSDKETH